MDLRMKLNDVLASARDGLIYDEEKSGLKARLLTVFADVLTVLDGLDTQERKVDAPPTGWRFCLALPQVQVWVKNRDEYGETGSYVDAPERYVYFIDGYVTESKILAIKQVRTLSKTPTGEHMGLKDAKDFVDSLQERAVRPTRSNSGL